MSREREREQKNRHLYFLDVFSHLSCVMKDAHGKRHGNIPVGLDLGILPASLPAPATQQHVIREVLSEKNVGGRLHTLVYLGAWLFADSHSDALVLSVCVWGGREGLLYIISKEL